ncbi:MAG: ATP synthase F1 subunit gamma [Desulfobulbus sp.]|nr:MAG: ATP synthase F1 subunit gamma [Desulfobulbus sp.]
MPGLKDVKDKIEGVAKTSQITQAMNMVASAKLRGAQERMEAFRPYSDKFAEAMKDLSGGMSGNLPLMEIRDVKTVEIVVITSDRGLCGSFNANILKIARKKMAAYEAEGKKVTFVTVGNKATQGLKRTGKIRQSFKDIMGTFQMFNAREISQDITHNFLSGESDQVELVYARFVSIAKQIPVAEELLPIKPVEVDENEPAPKKEGISGAYIYEPEPAEIMEVLLPLYLNVQVFHGMIEIGAGEHAARMTAMDNATTACGDIIKDLTQLYNKARQSAITGELMDIVGGAEALKG